MKNFRVIITLFLAIVMAMVRVGWADPYPCAFLESDTLPPERMHPADADRGHGRGEDDDCVRGEPAAPLAMAGLFATDVREITGRLEREGVERSILAEDPEVSERRARWISASRQRGEAVDRLRLEIGRGELPFYQFSCDKHFGTAVCECEALKHLLLLRPQTAGGSVALDAGRRAPSRILPFIAKYGNNHRSFLRALYALTPQQFQEISVKVDTLMTARETGVPFPHEKMGELLNEVTQIAYRSSVDRGFAETAAKHQIPLVYRRSTDAAESRQFMGQAPKPQSVKPKSSTMDGINGLIPVEALASKAGDFLRRLREVVSPDLTTERGQRRVTKMKQLESDIKSANHKIQDLLKIGFTQNPVFRTVDGVSQIAVYTDELCSQIEWLPHDGHGHPIPPGKKVAYALGDAAGNPFTADTDAVLFGQKQGIEIKILKDPTKGYLTFSDSNVMREINSIWKSVSGTTTDILQHGTEGFFGLNPINDVYVAFTPEGEQVTFNLQTHLPKAERDMNLRQFGEWLGKMAMHSQIAIPTEAFQEERNVYGMDIRGPIADWKTIREAAESQKTLGKEFHLVKLVPPHREDKEHRFPPDMIVEAGPLAASLSGSRGPGASAQVGSSSRGLGTRELLDESSRPGLRRSASTSSLDSLGNRKTKDDARGAAAGTVDVRSPVAYGRRKGQVRGPRMLEEEMDPHGSVDPTGRSRVGDRFEPQPLRRSYSSGSGSDWAKQVREEGRALPPSVSRSERRSVRVVPEPGAGSPAVGETGSLSPPPTLVSPVGLVRQRRGAGARTLGAPGDPGPLSLSPAASTSTGLVGRRRQEVRTLDVPVSGGGPVSPLSPSSFESPVDQQPLVWRGRLRPGIPPPGATRRTPVAPLSVPVDEPGAPAAGDPHSPSPPPDGLSVAEPPTSSEVLGPSRSSVVVEPGKALAAGERKTRKKKVRVGRKPMTGRSGATDGSGPGGDPPRPSGPEEGSAPP